MYKLIIIGAGGHAKSVIDSLPPEQFRLQGFVDYQKPIGSMHLGYPILANRLDQITDAQNYVYFVAIGNNELRQMRYREVIDAGQHVINVIDRTAIVSPHATLGHGCFVGKLAIVNHSATVGNNCVINSRALVEHDATIGDHANVSTGAFVNGDVVVDEGAFVGSGATVIGQLRIGAWSVVGAGTVVIRDVAAYTTVVGVPARVIKSDNRL